MFSIDPITQSLNFLGHTDLQRNTAAPVFSKQLFVNYCPGRGQRLQFNVYSAAWDDDSQDNGISETDRQGSVMIALDKIASLYAVGGNSGRTNFTPIQLELPLWHDNDVRLQAQLQQRQSTLRCSIKASDETVSTAALRGPQAQELTFEQALDAMRKGCTMLKYAFTSDAKPDKRQLFYDSSEGAMGTSQFELRGNTHTLAESMQRL